MGEKVLVSWSGGKDSALVLYELLKSAQYEVAALLTTLTEDYDRVSMHGTRRRLLTGQAEALGFPLEKVYISKSASNAEYESRMGEVLTRYLRAGVGSVAFGDIFLGDLRKHREENLSRLTMTGIFPLWRRNTAGLAEYFVDSGFKAVVTCVDSEYLSGDFVGREYGREFLSDLPDGVDWCGENGEFHSFVYDGPILHQAIRHRQGETVLREERFWYSDLKAVNGDSAGGVTPGC